jgi:hypothetical protein
MGKRSFIGFKKDFLRSAPCSLLFILCSLLYAFVMLLYALCSPLVAEAADKLVIKDSGRTTKFVVKEDGKVGIMTANPVGGLQTGGIRC